MYCSIQNSITHQRILDFSFVGEAFMWWYIVTHGIEVLIISFILRLSTSCIVDVDVTTFLNGVVDVEVNIYSFYQAM